MSAAVLTAMKMLGELRAEQLGMQTAVVVAICVLGIAISVKSTLVLGRYSPWTSAGWLFTVLYFIAVIAKDVHPYQLYTVSEYVALAALALTFVVAGVRDEAQAEPWWWPTHRGQRRAERRKAG